MRADKSRLRSSDGGGRVKYRTARARQVALARQKYLQLGRKKPLALPRCGSAPFSACAEGTGVRDLPDTDLQLADRGAPAGFGLVHVFGDEGGVFEFTRGHSTHDIGDREVAHAFFHVECSDKAVVALFGIGGLAEIG